MIALAADEVVLDAHAVPGPVDLQFGEFLAASLMKAVHAKDLNPGA